jgi:photosystem II stability/assembly factor-like uncharacterized protein
VNLAPRLRAGIAVVAAGAALLVSAGCARDSERTAPKSPGEWREIPLGTDAVFSGLHFVDADTGWIVGASPFVAGGVAGRTEDGGRTWRFVTGVTHGGPTSGLSAVHGFDRLRACAVGNGVFFTLDGGESWQRAATLRTNADHLGALHFRDGTEGWAAGPAGIVHTTDGGMTWTGADVPADSPVQHVNARVVHFTDARDGWVAGQHGALYRTRDGGATWARVPIPAPPAAAHLPFLFGGTWTDSAHAWLVGEYGTILRTQDGGDSWTLVDAGTSEAFFAAVSFAGEDGWIAGFLPDKARSVVYRTRDGGATWSLEKTLDGEEMRSLQVLANGAGWAVGARVRTEPQRLLVRARPAAR